eukprot:scaffold2908_cov257-Pinguiococcus_pyrenoidosus.AAC.26
MECRLHLSHRLALCWGKRYLVGVAVWDQIEELVEVLFLEVQGSTNVHGPAAVVRRLLTLIAPHEA